MRLFKLKTSWLAFVLSIITLVLHLGTGYLLAGVIKNQMLAGIWQHSLTIYWPAFDLIVILGPNGNGGSLMGIVLMIIAALLELWVTFSVGIWLIRLYFQKPPISNVSKMAIPVIALVIAVCFYKASPVALGDPRSSLERAVESSDTNAVEKILKSNPTLANKLFRFGNETPLFRATECRNPKANIDLLIKYGADINAKSGGFNLTPLQQAAWSGKLEAVKALLAHKPDVNASCDSKDLDDGSTALNFAFVADNKEIFNLLLEAGADINHGRSVLAECMGRGDRDSWAEFLLSKGADANYLGPKGDRFVPIIQAVLSGNTNYVAALLRHHVDLTARYINGADNFSPLELAMDEGHMDIAVLIRNYVMEGPTNTVGFAAAHGNSELLSRLLQSNSTSINERDDLGFTPLHWAAQAGQDAIVKQLLVDGASINSTDPKGNTPLHWAVFTGHSNVVEMLIANKAGLNVKGSGEKSPLYLAVQQGFTLLAEMLLKAGADPNIATSSGETPICVAVASGNLEALKLLLAYHANLNVKNSGDSIFQVWAGGTANLEIANHLLANGCDAKAKGREGKTPLHVLVEAASWQRGQDGQIQAVQWLLDHKADVNAKDDKGKTPLSLLKYHGGGRVIERRKDIGDLLRKYGAKE